MKIGRVFSGIIVFMMVTLPCCIFQSCTPKTNTKITDTGSFNYIEKYTGGFPNEIAGKITIKHLLTHTSGLGDIFTPDYMAHKDEIDTIARFMPYIINQPLRFEPGERHQYSAIIFSNYDDGVRRPYDEIIMLFIM
jgi:hypothetical protein